MMLQGVELIDAFHVANLGEEILAAMGLASDYEQGPALAFSFGHR